MSCQLPTSPPPRAPTKQNEMFKFHLWDDLDLESHFCGEEWLD